MRPLTGDVHERLRRLGRVVLIVALACLLPVWAHVYIHHDELAVRGRYECSVCTARARTADAAEACAYNRDRRLLAFAPWFVADNDYVSDGCDRSVQQRVRELDMGASPSVARPTD